MEYEFKGTPNHCLDCPYSIECLHMKACGYMYHTGKRRIVSPQECTHYKDEKFNLLQELDNVSLLSAVGDKRTVALKNETKKKKVNKQKVDTINARLKLSDEAKRLKEKKIKKYHDKLCEKFSKLYAMGFNDMQIAQKCSCSKYTVGTWRKSKGLLTATENRLKARYEMWESGMTDREIAEAEGLATPDPITNWRYYKKLECNKVGDKSEKT